MLIWRYASLTTNKICIRIPIRRVPKAICRCDGGSRKNSK